MIIRLINCNLLISFENISLAGIVVNIFSAKLESRVWQRPSREYAVNNIKKYTLKTPL